MVFQNISACEKLTYWGWVCHEYYYFFSVSFQGADVSSVGAPSGAPPPPGPPPPPCPPPPVLLDAPAPSGDQGDPRSALFADLNKGADITKGKASHLQYSGDPL